MFHGLRLFFVAVLVSVGIPLTVWLSGFAAFAASVHYMSAPAIITQTDAVIVLTGGTNRVRKGLDLLAQGRTKNLLISGVHKDVRISDLRPLWHSREALPEASITLGHEADNTIGNALEARTWIAEKQASSVRLITATYHMPRALLEFHHVMPDVEIIAHPVEPEHFTAHDSVFWKTNFIEYNKLLGAITRVLFFPAEKTSIPEAFQ